VLKSYAGLYRRTIGLGIDHVWILGALAAFGFVVAIKPITPNDLWWHMKIGEITFMTRSIQTTNMFSWTVAHDFPFTYGAWLGEVLLYLLYLLGKLPLVIFTRTILAVGVFALVGYEAKRRTGSWRLAGVAATLAAAMSSNNMEIRPQMWSWLPFLAFFILLSSYVDGWIRPRTLLVLPLIMIFWVNVHGAFILGFILLGIFGVGEILRILFKQEGACSWADIRWLVFIGAMCLASIIVNPKFLGTFGYVMDLMTDKPSQELVIEWQSPAPNNYATIVFFISILLMLAVFAYSKHRPTPTEMLLVIGFMWLAWTGLRYVIWFSMIAMPILAQEIYELIKDKPWLNTPPPKAINLILVILLFIPFFLVQPWFIEKMPLPQKYWNLVLKDTGHGPLLSTDTPVGAGEYLKEHPGGKLFNDMGYGSYLIWAVPDQGVFADPRVELYPYEQWMDYIRITAGVRYNELLDQYGADRILIDKTLQDEFSEILSNDPLWRVEFEDEYSQLWAKNPSTNP